MRRVLTDADLRAVHAAASTATSPAQLLADSLAALATALHEPTSPLAPGSPGGPVVPAGLAGYAIPARQWDAIFDVITGRARTWGLDAEIGLDLALNLLPAAYDDPDPAQSVPAPTLSTDLRPHEHHLRLTRSAVETIAACHAHLRRLSAGYGRDSAVYRLAADSWTELVTALLTSCPQARVSGHGPLGLLVESTGGTAWTLTYRTRARRCTTPGCHARLDDDTTAATDATGVVFPGAAVPDHQHTPSHPLHAPSPGRWIATY